MHVELSSDDQAVSIDLRDTQTVLFWVGKIRQESKYLCLGEFN